MPLGRWMDIAAHARIPGAAWPWDKTPDSDVSDEAMARARALAATC